MNVSPRPFLPRPFGFTRTAWIAILATVSAAAGDPPAMPAPDPPPPSQSFDTPTTFHYYPSAGRRPEAARLFLPPDPPTLGQPVPLSNPFRRGEPAPPELAPFVHEIFYPSLATRLAGRQLPKSIEERLQDYRSRKRARQDELRSRLAALKDEDDATRALALAQLAAAQAPALAELEAAADRLRTELRRKDLLGQPLDEGDWASPATAAGAPGHWSAAAFYQDGLSIEQRLLLQEAALLQRNAPADRTGTGADRIRYFSPATSSFRLAAGPAPALARKLADFEAVKRGLAAELIAQLSSAEPRDDATRTEAFRRLAAAQAPRFAALEALAEEIRRDLARDPAAPGPPTPHALPPDLSARIAVYRAHKQEAIRTLHEMLAADADAARAIRFPTRDDDAAPADPPSGRHEIVLPPGVTAFEHKQGELVAALNQEKNAIREALSDYVRAAGAPRDRKSIDDLLRDFEDARQQQELWARFRDYQAAVLMPGLSPAQRRLLFDAAVEELAPPLPPGRPAS